MAIRHAEPDDKGQFTFYTDCKWVLDSFCAGPSNCTASSHVGSALWRKLFNAIDDVFLDISKVHVLKVRAHTSVSECMGSLELLWLRAGNTIADIGAKMGAKNCLCPFQDINYAVTDPRFPLAGSRPPFL